MQTSQITTASIVTARKSAAWIDRSGWTLLRLTGADRSDLLHRLTTNDLRDVRSGHGKHTVLLTDKARIIDIIGILHDADSSYLLCSPGQKNTIVAWLRKYIIMDDVHIYDASSEYTMIEVCGPRSSEAVDSLLGVSVGGFALDQWCSVVVDGSNVIVTRQPSACEVSYWIIAPTATAQSIRASLHENPSLIPKLSAADSDYVRILAGMGKHGNEWTDAYNPLEAGLLHLTSFAKGCYIGQEVVARLDSYNKVKQRVMGLASAERLHVGMRLYAEATDVGVITSVTASADGSHWFALGYVRGEHAHPNAPLTAGLEGTRVGITQHQLPMDDPTCQ
ncbi:MAG: hypothetical protein FJ211_05165 [Ignavibacteria bacterium]|nr:hypothetical protein [Ignavibacteria bacterium]